MTAAIAVRARCAAALPRLAGACPIADAAERRRENALLAEAIRREGEPGAWCHVGDGELTPRLDPERPEGLDGPGLRGVLGWLEAADATRAAWTGPEAARHPGLAALAGGVPELKALREGLAAALDPDGRVRDDASPALRRARHGLAAGEREVERGLERWARGFGEQAYVTRHGDRFVACVPAAGFPRRRALVHDVSGSGHSLFVEPFEVCESNNRLLELRAVVAEEELRILRELAGAARSEAGALTELEARLAHLDSLRARGAWARDLGAIALDPGGARLRLVAARHPLLAAGPRAAEVVPLDLELEDGARVLLVSGPNMGGKTVLLKTVGLAVALAHAAMPVPAAEGSAVPEIDHLLADLGDEQSVDQGLSTFAGHLRALRAMAESAGPRALMLADELGAGTDPAEGGALGRALVERLAARGAWAVLTTHLGSLKLAAAEVDGVANGSLEFDEETFASRYRFLPGIPGASHALSVAERLGFPGDLLARAREMTPESTRAIERLLAGLKQAREHVDAQAAALERARAEAEAARDAARDATEDARRTLEESRRRLTRESEAVLAQVRELWQEVQREARRAEKDRARSQELRGGLESAESRLEALREATEAAIAEVGGNARPVGLEQVETGQRVRVRDLGIEAEVVSAPDAEGRVLLRRGSWSIQSHVSRLGPAEGAAAPRPSRPGASWEAPAETPLEVDLRGCETDEALRALDEGLDRAVLGGMNELRVIHGVGRGVLRAAVERHLRAHSQVSGQRLGVVGEGGRGVTIVKLR